MKAGDKVLVQARLPRGTKAPVTEEPVAESSTDDPVAEEPVADEAPAAIKARKLVVLSRPAPRGRRRRLRRRTSRQPEDD